MYTDFYHLKEKPFNLTSSSRFLYLGESHNEAYALLTYGVIERKGFILLTGEVGTGKTTIVRAFLENLDPKIQSVYLSNPLVSPSDFINYLAFSALKRKEPVGSKIDFLIEFESFLKTNLQHQRNFLLIIDEAHKLSFDLLEEIRLLSNMEVGEEKLINIILVGQPELNEKLSQPECRPLLQRISLRHHIQPLDIQATGEYVATRLKAAGDAQPEHVFPRPTIKAIHRYSGGFPRLINILADNALLHGFSRGRRKITPGVVRECFEEMELAPTAAVLNKTEPERPQARNMAPRAFWLGYARFATAAIAVIFAGVVFASYGPNSLLGSRNQTDHVHPIHTATAESVQEPVDNAPVQIHNDNANKVIAPPTNAIPTEICPETPVITVQAGDTLIELVASAYGKVDDDIIRFVLQSNPEVVDLNRIEIGQQIRFPSSAAINRLPFFTVHIASFGSFRSAYKLYQRLSTEGYEVFILPGHDSRGAKAFRIAVGHFAERPAAREYASMIIKRDVSNYAEPMEVENLCVSVSRPAG